MSARNKPTWITVQRVFLGVDAWTGKHKVAGFCALYEVTEGNAVTLETRTHIERSTPVYLHSEQGATAAPIFHVFITAQAELKRIAEKEAK